jgi:tape measure domain-containing protein
MSRMSLDTAIRLSAEVKGGGNIDRVKKSLQDLGKNSQTTAREISTLRAATFQFARANDNTIAGIRSSIGAFRGLQEQAKIGSREFQRYGAEIQKLEGKLRGLDGTAAAAGDSLGRRLAAGLAGSLATIGAGRAIGGSLSAVVASEESERRLRSLSQGLDDYSRVQATATAAAQRFGTAQTQTNQEFAQIYARLRPVGLTLEEISTVYNGFNTAAKLSGTTSAEASAAFLQLSQALGTGVLRGEELNSVFEQTPAVVQGIAEVMGVPIGQIRELAKEGRITGDIVLTALGRIERDGAPKLAEAMKGPAQQFRNLQIAGQELQIQFGQSLLPITIALTKAATGILEQTSKLPEPIKQVGAAAAVAGVAVLGLTTAMSAIGGISAATKAMQAYAASTGAATAAQTGLNLAVLANPWVLAAAGIIAATAAAYKFIEPFREFVNTYPERFKLFWGSIAADAQASFKRITDAATAMGQFLAKGVQNIANSFATMFGWARDRAGEALRAIGVDGQWLAGAMQSVSATIGNVFSAAFDFVQSRWQQTISNMINYSNPFMAILASAGINVGDAAVSAMQTGQQRLQAAGVPNTYTVGGITYDTATGRPVAGAAPFVPQAPGTLPGAPPAPALPGAAGGGGAGAGGSAGRAATERAAESIGAQIAKSLQSALNLTPAQAAGIVGNLIRESGLNPRINEGGAVGLPRGVGGYGLAQWTGSRQTDLVRFAGGPAAAGNLQTQLRFMVSELLGPESRALASLRRATTPEEAAVVFDRDYERSGIKALPERKANARRVFSEIAGTGPGAGLDDFASTLQAEAKAAEDLQQKQAEANKRLEEFVEARTKSITELEKEIELSGATTEIDRQRLEYAFERNEIIDKAKQQETDLLAIQEELKQLGINQNIDKEKARIETEKNRALLVLQKREEQEINDLIAERVRMMQALTLDVMSPSAYNPLEQQKADLDALLQKYPMVGAAADQAAELASRGFADMVTGARSAKEVFADFLKGMADALIQTAKTMIAQYIAIGIAKMFAFPSAPGMAFNPSAAGPFGAGGLSTGLSFTPGFTGFANGGVMSSRGPMPLRTYSRGGVANSPQVAVFGEGMMNEAYVPLPDGRRIPVAMQMRDDVGRDRMRELMGASPAGNGSPVLNMSFETGYDPINKVEYVTVEQLQASARETRKLAASDGAKRGMSMTLDRLQQSPSTRSRVGIR